jgi:hypothetical protein
MKRMFAATIGTLPLLIAGSLAFFAPHTLKAAVGPDSGRRGCSIHQLTGQWGYSYVGSITAGPAAGPAASVGSFTEDAAGNISGSQTRSFNGDIAEETLNGTITLNPDCTAVATINVYLNGALERSTVLNAVYVDNERAFRAIFTMPYTVITIDGKKIDPQ